MNRNTNEPEVINIIIVRKKNHRAHKQHSTAWKIALADFMTTLMILFFVMWVITITPPDKKKQLVSFFQGKEDSSQTGSNGLLPEKATIDKRSVADVAKIFYALESKMKASNPDMKVYLGRSRIEINLRANVLFGTGDSKLTPEFKKIIGDITAIVQKKNIYLDIYGYTDDVPILHGTNLFLSSERAKSAAEEFIKNGIDPDRLGVHGEGSRYPAFPNDTPEDRSKNRRIVIYISPIENMDSSEFQKVSSDMNQENKNGDFSNFGKITSKLEKSSPFLSVGIEKNMTVVRPANPNLSYMVDPALTQIQSNEVVNKNK